MDFTVLHDALFNKTYLDNSLLAQLSQANNALTRTMKKIYKAEQIL